MTKEQIAQVAHEVNKAYCIALGDNSQTTWDEAPEWQKLSAINGVSFHLENPNAGADSSHNSWMKEKVEAGWIYGEIKDAEAKTHPCIVPFESLPKEQQAKDYLFKQVVHSLKNFL
jgi:preprotein translocase subunit SecA